MEQELNQVDFSGGINLVDDPSDMAENQVSDARNMILTSSKRLQQRGGFVQYNSSAIGASTEVRSIYQFKNVKGSYYPVVQASDSKIYVGSAGAPATGSFTSILSETASAKPACFTDYEGVLVMTNGVDVPMQYEGAYGKIDYCYFTQDTNVTFTDFSTEVTDNGTSTFAFLNDMDTYANGDALYVGVSVAKVKAIRLEFGASVNNNAATSAVTYWNGSAFTAVANATDGTAAAGATFAQTGDITFDECTISPYVVNSTCRYWLRIAVSAAIDDVKITGIYVKYDMQAIPVLWDGTFENPIGVFKTTDNGGTYTNDTTHATDGSTSTVFELSSLDTVANGDWAVVRATNKFVGMYITMSAAVNGTAVVLACHYWNGAWTALTINDGTATGGATLAKSGYVWWALPTDWYKSNSVGVGDSAFELRISVDAALDASTDIAEIDNVPQYDPYGVYDLCAFHKSRLMLANISDGPHYVDISGEFNIHDNYSDDTDSIGLPVEEEITCIKQFFNELFIGTANATYLLEGYSPSTFGLLHVQSGGVGPVNYHGVVRTADRLFFMHSTGFYIFDGTKSEPISDNISLLFDDRETTYYIPTSRFEDVQGRYNSTEGCIDWAVTSGSSDTTNDLVLSFWPKYGCWFFHDFVASSMATLQCANGQEAWYHGGYVGKIYNDYDNLFTDGGSAVTAYVTSRGYSAGPERNVINVFRGLQVKTFAQSSGTLTISYGVDGATSLTAYSDTPSMVNSGYTYVWPTIHDVHIGNSVVFKVQNATSGVPLELEAIKVYANAGRRKTVV